MPLQPRLRRKPENSVRKRHTGAQTLNSSIALLLGKLESIIHPTRPPAHCTYDCPVSLSLARSLARSLVSRTSPVYASSIMLLKEVTSPLSAGESSGERRIVFCAVSWGFWNAENTWTVASPATAPWVLLSLPSTLLGRLKSGDDVHASSSVNTASLKHSIVNGMHGMSESRGGDTKSGARPQKSPNKYPWLTQ